MIEEVESTVSHLKKRKSPGPNGLVAEHLQDREMAHLHSEQYD